MIFASHDALHPRASRGGRQRESRRVSPVGFLPVHVAAERRPEGGRGIEMLLGDDRVLRIQPGFDRQTLLDVLGALEGRGC